MHDIVDVDETAAFSGTGCSGTNQGSTEIHDSSSGQKCVLMSNAHSFQVSPGAFAPAGTCGHVRASFYNNFQCSGTPYNTENYGNNECVPLGGSGQSHDAAFFTCD